MGIGKSGEPVDVKKLKVKIGNIMAENGKIVEQYDEKKLKEYMSGAQLKLKLT